MKITIGELRRLVESVAGEMESPDQEWVNNLKRMSKDELISQYSDLYKEKNNIRPALNDFVKLSREEMIDDIIALSAEESLDSYYRKLGYEG